MSYHSELAAEMDDERDDSGWHYRICLACGYRSEEIATGECHAVACPRTPEAP